MKKVKLSYCMGVLMGCCLMGTACSTDEAGGDGGTTGVVSGVVLEDSVIQVPKEGGSYTVAIKTAETVYLEVPPAANWNVSFGGDSEDEYLDVLPSVSVNEEYFFYELYEEGFLEGQAMSVSVEMRDRMLYVVVGQARSRAERTKKVPLYDRSGKVVATLLIRQEGDPDLEMNIPQLGDTGRSLVLDMASDMSAACKSYAGLEACYVGWDDDPGRRIPLQPDDGLVTDCWNRLYRVINLNLTIQQADLSLAGCYVDYLTVFRALVYYQLVTFWGNVAVIPEDRYTTGGPLSQPTERETLQMLVDEMEDARQGLEEKPCVALAEDANEILFVSHDVARAVLADIYMYMGEWSKAENLLEEIAGHGYYSPEPCNGSGYGGSDWLLAFRDGTGENFPVLLYTDVLLSLAECKWHEGESDGAAYVENVARVNGLQVADGSLESIRSLREALRLPGYFAFLKRNGLAQEELQLSDDYQLLLPIPRFEIMDSGGGLVQNPGY